MEAYLVEWANLLVRWDGATPNTTIALKLTTPTSYSMQATALGARHTVISTVAEAAAHIRALTGGEGPDVVIEAVGKPATYRLALDLVAACGRIVYIGWVKGDIALEARQIVAKEVDILGSRNATDEFAEVIALFESGRIDPLALVTNRVLLDDVPAMFKRWAERPESVGKILVEI